MPMDKYLASIIHPFLTRPELAHIRTSTNDREQLLTLIIAKEDMGPIIGKGGENASCIRHLVRGAGLRHGMTVSVKILEPEDVTENRESGGSIL